MNWRKFVSVLAGPDNRVLRDGIRILAKASTSERRKHPQALHEQPFDSILLNDSKLFSLSRKIFLKGGGKFYSTLISSPRTLSSSMLLENRIEYSPVEKELIWAATDASESADLKKLTHLFQTRNYVTSLFHEQNHRILWTTLPPPSKNAGEASRYLNFIESLVITLDMALGDELGHAIARIFYMTGTTYDPGTDIRLERPSKRAYRNYLHACLYATYLKLEFFETEDIRKAVHHLYPQEKQLTERAIRRAVRLDDAFVRITNPLWQESNLETVIRELSRKSRRSNPGIESLKLRKDPLDNHLQYLWTERWLEQMGL